MSSLNEDFTVEGQRLNEDINVPQMKCTACQINVPLNNKLIHYRSDWHRYNVKRRCVNLLPIPYNLFQKKLNELILKGKSNKNKRLNKKNNKKYNELIDNTQWNLSSKLKNINKKNLLNYNCKLCNKKFKSPQQIESHLKNKKHFTKFAKYINQLKNKNTNDNSTDDNNDESNDVELPKLVYTILNNPFVEVREIDLDSNNGDQNGNYQREIIPVNHNVFGPEKFDTMEEAQAFMSRKYGFFIPFPIKLKNPDITELMEEVGEIIGVHYQCIWCWKQFKSLKAVQTHMIDMQHCKIQLDYGPKFIYEPVFVDNIPNNDGNTIEEATTIDGNNNNNNDINEDKKSDTYAYATYKTRFNYGSESVFLKYFNYGSNITVNEQGIVVAKPDTIATINDSNELIRHDGTKIGHRNNSLLYKQNANGLPRMQETCTEEQLISQLNNPQKRIILQNMIHEEQIKKLEQSGTKIDRVLIKKDNIDNKVNMDIRSHKLNINHFKGKDQNRMLY